MTGCSLLGSEQFDEPYPPRSVPAAPLARLRYLVGLWMLQRAGPVFPWGTLFVNVTGSFLIRFSAQFIMHKMGASPEIRVS